MENENHTVLKEHIVFCRRSVDAEQKLKQAEDLRSLRETITDALACIRGALNDHTGFFQLSMDMLAKKNKLLEDVSRYASYLTILMDEALWEWVRSAYLSALRKTLEGSYAPVTQEITELCEKLEKVTGIPYTPKDLIPGQFPAFDRDALCMKDRQKTAESITAQALEKILPQIKLINMKTVGKGTLHFGVGLAGQFIHRSTLGTKRLSDRIVKVGEESRTKAYYLVKNSVEEAAQAAYDVYAAQLESKLISLTVQTMEQVHEAALAEIDALAARAEP